MRTPRTTRARLAEASRREPWDAGTSRRRDDVHKEPSCIGGLAERLEQPRLEDLLQALRRQPPSFERELEVVDLHLLDLGRRQRVGRRPRRVVLDVHRHRRRRGLLSQLEKK